MFGDGEWLVWMEQIMQVLRKVFSAVGPFLGLLVFTFLGVLFAFQSGKIGHPIAIAIAAGPPMALSGIFLGIGYPYVGTAADDPHHRIWKIAFLVCLSAFSMGLIFKSYS